MKAPLISLIHHVLGSWEWSSKTIEPKVLMMALRFSRTNSRPASAAPYR